MQTWQHAKCDACMSGQIAIERCVSVPFAWKALAYIILNRVKSCQLAVFSSLAALVYALVGCQPS